MLEKGLQTWELLTYHAGCALRAEFQRYRLHFVWWFLEPLFNLTVLYVVFGIFMASGQPHFALFLLSGLILWQWFGNAVNHAANSIYGSRHSFQQVKIHPLHFPAVIFLRDTAKYAPVFSLYLAAMLFFGPVPLSLDWLAILPVLLVAGLCVFGTAVLAAAAVPFLPDLAVVVPIVLSALFFAAGIFFSIDDLVLPEHRMILYSNPIAVCIKSLRDILLAGRAPDWGLLGYAALVSLAFLAAGLALVFRACKTYPRLITQ